MSSPTSIDDEPSAMQPAPVVLEKCSSREDNFPHLKSSSNPRSGSGVRFIKKFMDDADGSDDYTELKHSLITKRRLSDGHRSKIQQLNYEKSRLLNLPTEVLLQIFHYLDRKDLYALLTVCREFADLIIEILWFRPNMQNDHSFKYIKEIMELPREKTHWDYRLFIKRLNLSFMTKLVDDHLLSLFTGCPKLERLTLVNCNKLTYKPITQVLQNCERLQSIDLTGVADVRDEIIDTLAANCKRLQGLYAPGCGKVSESSIINLIRSCPMLKRLKFNNSEKITDETILAMHENCKSLVEIDLHNCPNVTNKHLRSVFSSLLQLREFRISNAAGITDQLLELLPDEYCLEKLRIVDITGCNAITDKLVEKLVICAPRLRNVVLSKCMQITDASLRALSQLGRSLHYVHLGHCASITDFGVASLVRSCHRIQYIDLACCSQLTDWTLVELANLPRLRRIGLVKCNLISDTGIMELVRRRGEQDCLERIHLSYCTNLSLGPIQVLLNNCPKLTHLSLTGIHAFLRREITQYCRDPPADFSEQQKNQFCVFSGNGVNQLRQHLNMVLTDGHFNVQHGNDMNAVQDRRRRFMNGQNVMAAAAAAAAIMGNDRQGVLPDEMMEEDNDTATTNNNDTTTNMDTVESTNGNGSGIANGDRNLRNFMRQRFRLMAAPEMQQNPEMAAINREIFRELNQGNMNPNEMREHFNRLLQAQQGILEQQTDTAGQAQAQGAAPQLGMMQIQPNQQPDTPVNMTGFQEYAQQFNFMRRMALRQDNVPNGGGQRDEEGGLRITQRGSNLHPRGTDLQPNTPQIDQPAVFPNQNAAPNVDLNELDSGDEDAEMEPTLLFPPIQ
ncbi:SCF ubiquitin ligase complex subunit [Scheffersomyces spartinae]|uniref:SCF ubiquitin ligase complex subunit n=1 Tax=Scheffersomyces spartinae TaxID=45513 RepID=A0A9P7VC61_9ASCO|nr:SCF ubiquitin ligase complex subunit [Scheffersomyces spartinae]KAG7195403.1 SCF ubiquitin ligase complex subunit [Scheffersomyces spartinae]